MLGLFTLAYWDAGTLSPKKYLCLLYRWSPYLETLRMFESGGSWSTSPIAIRLKKVKQILWQRTGLLVAQVSTQTIQLCWT